MLTNLTAGIDEQQANSLQGPLDEIQETRLRYGPTIVADSKADDTGHANVCNKQIPVGRQE